MIPETADVVIIGSGVMGLSTAYYLKRKSVNRIIVLERDSVIGGHSTGRCAGGFRHQFSTNINVSLSRLSIDLLAAFDDETHCGIGMNRCGYLFALTENDDIASFRAAMELQKSAGIDTTWLSNGEIQKMLPMIECCDVVGGSYTGSDGLLDVGAIVNGYITSLKANGVIFLPKTPATGIVIRNGSVTSVLTPRGSISTSVVVNSAGPWAASVSKMTSIDLPVTRVKQQLFVTSEIPWVSKDLPVVVFPGQGIGFHREGKGLLSGMHRMDPNGTDPNVDPAWEALHCEKLVERIPSIARSSVASSWAGYYAMTADHHPIVGRVSGIIGMYSLAGFCGHGFMHSPACGMLMSEEIVDGKAFTLDISALSAERFDHNTELTREFLLI
jgi:sarcosine oxidase subunit beta